MFFKKHIALLLALIMLPLNSLPTFAQDSAAKPDPKIAAEDLSISPTTIKDGVSAVFKAKVRNGSATKATNIKVKFFADEVLLGEKIISSISANGYYSSSVTYKIPATMAGEQKYKVVVDPDNSIDESDEKNNEATKPFTVLSNLPDFSIVPADMSFTPVALKAGDKAIFKAVIQNIGIATGKNAKVKFFLGKTVIGETIITSLSAKGKTSKQVTYTLPSDFSGDSVYYVSVDTENAVKELSEDNNKAEVQLGVSSSDIDLTVIEDSITFSKANPKPGESVKISAVLKNLGNTDATAVTARFMANEVNAGEKTKLYIKAGKEKPVYVMYKIPANSAGSLPVSVTADPDNVLTESDETNNSAKAELSVDNASAGSADISVVSSDLSYTGNALMGGSKTTLKAKITNIGADKASDVYVRFFADGEQIYEKKLPSISKNGNATVTYPYTIPADSGSFTFSVTADPDNVISEADETNNSAQTEVPVTTASNNLLITSFTPSKTNPEPGQTMSWKIKVKNAGNAKISDVKIALYTDMESPDPTNTITAPSISPGITITKSISWKVPAKLDPPINYLVRAAVDPDNALSESDELDNIANYSLSLKVPDLSIELGEYMGTSGMWTTGTFSQFRVKIKNNDVANLTNVKLGLYYALGSVSADRVKVSDVIITPFQKNKTYDQMFDRVFMPSQAAIGSAVYFFAVADPDKNIPESDETNNELIFKYTVVQKKPQATCPCIYVTVHDEDGNPLAGTVKLENTATGSVSTKTAGSDTLTSNAPGMVVFENLSTTAPVKITVTKTGYRTLTDTFTYLSSDEDTKYRTYDMDKKAVVYGKVTNQAGQPLQWVTVKVEGTSLEDVTDANGDYGFMLNGGAYTFRFLKTGYGRIIASNLQINPLTTLELNKTMSTTNAAYTSGMVTNDEGVGLSNVDIYVNGNIVAFTAADGHFVFNNMSAGTKTFKFKKPGYIDTEFTEVIEAGNEYILSFTMFKPSTDTHVERGTQFVAWHQHEGTPANAFFIPEYNVDIWWGLGRVKMGMDFTQNGSGAKLTKLTINNHGENWECNKVEGSGDIETSAIDIPITIAAGSCSGKKTQMDVYKVAIESGGSEVWSNNSFWTSASDPMNTGTNVFNLGNLDVTWDNDLKVKMWVRVQKRAVAGTGGDGAGALVGYHLDKKLITWYPQKPPTTVISTSWGQVGGYFLGILDNPVNAVTGFTDIFTVESFNQYTMEDVLPQNFPGYISN